MTDSDRLSSRRGEVAPPPRNSSIGWIVAAAVAVVAIIAIAYMATRPRQDQLMADIREKGRVEGLVAGTQSTVAAANDATRAAADRAAAEAAQAAQQAKDSAARSAADANQAARDAADRVTEPASQEPQTPPQKP